MISVKNLKYTYPKTSVETLHGVSFSISEGEIFGFLGPSGAGKSTTQKVLNGLLKNYSGEVIINGTHINSIDQSFYENIGIAFEFPNLYEKLSALENLKLYASFYQKNTLDPVYLLEKVGLEDDKNTRIEAFSKGMKMRLNFVRSLINEPKILFLDEPTSGLDPTNARKIKDMIREVQQKGTTVFLTTHHMLDADELCDRLALMVDGRLAEIDSPMNLKLQHGKRSVCTSYRENQHLVKRDFALNEIGNNDEFFQILKEKDIETIHTQEASLEDVFIKVTGKQLLQA